jgi:hypothetical protein
MPRVKQQLLHPNSWVLAKNHARETWTYFGSKNKAAEIKNNYVGGTNKK